MNEEIKPCHICGATDKPTEFTKFCSATHTFDPPRIDGVLVENPWVCPYCDRKFVDELHTTHKCVSPEEARLLIRERK